MEIVRHYHQDGTLQRSVVKDGRDYLRRIARFMEPNGEFCKDVPEPPVWMERIHSGDYHIIVDANRVSNLERQFIETIILESRKET